MASRPELPVKLYYRIGEVAEIVGVEPHVLRYWESEFGTIRPQKSPKGQRVYSRRDLEKLLRVKELLYDEGYTIAGAKKRLREAPTATTAAASATPAAATSTAPVSAAPRALESVTTTPSEDVREAETSIAAPSIVAPSPAAASGPVAAPVAAPSPSPARPPREAWRISAAGARTPVARDATISATDFSAALEAPAVDASSSASTSTTAFSSSPRVTSSPREASPSVEPGAPRSSPIGLPSSLQPSRVAATSTATSPNSPAVVSQAILAAARADATRAESRWAQARGEIRELRDSLRSELARIDAVGFELDDVELGAEGFERYDAAGFDPSGFARGD